MGWDGLGWGGGGGGGGTKTTTIRSQQNFFIGESPLLLRPLHPGQETVRSGQLNNMAV